MKSNNELFHGGQRTLIMPENSCRHFVVHRCISCSRQESSSLIHLSRRSSLSVNDFNLKVKVKQDTRNLSSTEQGFASCELLLEATKWLGVMSKELSALVNEK